MRPTTLSRAAAALALIGLTGLVACDNPADLGDDELRDVPVAVTEAKADGPFGEPLRLYTRNIYLGADTGPLYSVDFTDLPAIAAQASDFWSRVQATDFPTRAGAIADEIALTEPHVVGLQEVSFYAIKEWMTDQYVTTGGLNMVAELLTELAVRGQNYHPVSIEVSTGVGFPLELDPAAPNYIGVLMEVGVGDMILVRDGVQLAATPAQGTFQAGLPLGPFTVGRGWNRVAVNHNGQVYHVVNTHLEIQQFEEIQLLQTQELLESVVDGLDGVTVIIGDLNSDANGKPGEPAWTPTYDILRDAGFVDAWLQSTSHAGRGYTCCHAKDLLNGIVSFGERIDFILYRSDDQRGFSLPGPVHMDILGEEDGDQAAGGLWPADHAALFGGFTTPPGLAW